MTVSQESIIKEDDSNQSLDDVIHAQKQLDEELQQLKNRYSRYSQLVSFQQEEEDYLLKNKENVNPKRISLSLKRKKDVTYGLMPHDDITESFEEESKFEDKKSLQEMTKTANSFINSIKEKNLKMKKEFELTTTQPKEEKIEEKIKETKEESDNEGEEEDKVQDKEMNRLCDLVQSLLSEAQDAIDTKPELNHPDIGKDEEENPEFVIPKRLQSLNARRPTSSLNLDSLSGLDDSSISNNNKHFSILTDTTAIAQPLAPINTHCGDGLDDFDDFDMSKYDNLRSPYNAMTSTPNDEFMKGPNTSMADDYLNYPPPPSRFYPPPEYFYGANGYPPYFDPAYGPIPPYVWEEIQKQRLGLKPDEESNSEAAVSINRRKEDQEIIKQTQTTTTTTTTTTEVKKDKKEVVDGKALVKKRRRRKHHHRHIRPVDANGNICECPIHTKTLVKKNTSSKLFKAQFGSDTQLFLSFFASFFVTTILVTISCLWSVIQVMAGNVNDKNLSRLLMSSSENAIQNNKKKIEQILDKESSSESIESDNDSEDEEDDSDSESESESKLLTDGSSSSSSNSSNKFITAPSISDESEVINIPSNFKDTFNNENAAFSTTLNRNSTTSSVNTHRRRNSL